MKIAIGGKGGTGKTTVAGTLSRALGRNGGSVLAIDGDSNPNLSAMLGVPSREAEAVAQLPRELFVAEERGGERRLVMTRDPAEVLEHHTVAGPDGVRLLVGARVDHAGDG